MNFTSIHYYTLVFIHLTKLDLSFYLIHAYLNQMCVNAMAFHVDEMAFVEPIRRASRVGRVGGGGGRSFARSLAQCSRRVVLGRSTFERRRTLTCMSSLLMQKFHDGRSS